MQLSRQLQSRFRTDLDLIKLEYTRNDSFRALCSDFAVCARALARWKKSDGQESQALAEEYERWLAELEQEIEEWLLRLEKTA
jgi:hypothetical protein